MAMVKRTCQRCNASFEIRAHEVKVPNRGLFCSRICANKKRDWSAFTALNKIKRGCETCAVVFLVSPRTVKRGQGRFCSKKCFRVLRDNVEGKIPHGWEGNSVSYTTLHKWVRSKFGSPSECEFCDKQGTGRQMHWANVTGLYLQERDDWMRLCAKCHKFYDNFQQDNKLIAVPA